MFQLLRRGSSQIDSIRPLSVRSLAENTRLNLGEKTCLLCKLLNVNARLQIRDQSSLTRLNPNKAKRKRTKKKSLDIYTDILEVSKESSKLKRANVTKLTSADLNLLTVTNVELNELYKVKILNKDISKFLPHTYSNLTAEGIFNFEPSIVPLELPVTKPKRVQKIKPVPIEDIELLDTDLELQNVKDSLQPELVDEITEPATTEDSKQEKSNLEKSSILREHRNAIAAKTLAAYSEVCNHLRNPQRGLFALHFHESRARRDKQNRISVMKNINVYCTLLKGFANKGDYAKLNQVLKIMETIALEPDLNCYVAIFECLGRINYKNHYLKDIRIHVKEALKKGYTFDKIMNEGIFLNDQRELVLKTFEAYDNLYVPVFDRPKVWYNNHLVDHLNHEEQLNWKPTESKGYGELITRNLIQSKIKDQLIIEEAGYVRIKSIENKDSPTKEIIAFRKALDDQYKMWTDAAQTAFYRDLATLSAQRHALNLEPYLRSIPAKDFVEIMVQEAKKIAQGSETFSPEVPVLYKMLGGRVYAKYRVLRKQKTGVLEKTLLIHSKYCENYADSHTELGSVPTAEVYSNPRIQWQSLEYEHSRNGATLNMGHQPWVPSVLTSIGKFLYHIIMHDMKVDVNSMRLDSQHKNLLPAFYTIFRNQGRVVKEEIKPHPVLSKLYRASRPEILTFAANEMPMLCPPVPWTSVDLGGYLISPTDVVRLPFQASTQKERMNEAKPSQLYPNFDALNQLASIPWKVNSRILDVILEVFRNGGSSKLDVPEPPPSLPPHAGLTPEMTKTERYEIFKQKLQLRKKKTEMYSLWCDSLYRLSLANHFRDDIFWLPHNMDFRGRVYPVPPHLNHLGSDLARSMLVFAEARPLGPEGLDWLKIHLINLTGLKKTDCIQDRLDFANDMMGLILDSADNPLSGQQWWAKSDDPWQTLACCMEIADVVRSGMNPEDYRSHFPVHQDGSCNGLQHYAALGRDSAGAYSVNLVPSEVPQDVYSAVVSLVEDQRAKDEAGGIEIAKILNGFVKRKVIKQTIMTTVYGVTRFGARLQIVKQLKDIDDFPREAVWTASTYLTALTFESLRTMFTSTREIQDWFTECAKLISGVGGSLVEWVTPMGLPVVQPYIKYKKTGMPAGYEGFALDQYEKSNVMKQKNAFPPNFIHSLDSSHMMLTSLHSERAGITFVSVHDCYWTHPSTVHIMNKICREQFVALHSEPILEDLLMFLNDHYAYNQSDHKEDGSVGETSKKKLNRVLRQLPNKGDFDIKNVLNSVYFFS